MMSRTDAMRAVMDLCEAEEAAALISAATDHASTDQTETGDLHARVDDAWTELKTFMDSRPDLADPTVRDEYVPIKQRYDNAIEALGRSA